MNMYANRYKYMYVERIGERARANKKYTQFIFTHSGEMLYKLFPIFSRIITKSFKNSSRYLTNMFINFS